MKQDLERARRMAACLGVVSLALLSVSPLSAEAPKLRSTLKGHTNSIVAVAFSPDSKTVVSASHDGTLKLWDVTTGKVRATLGEPAAVALITALSCYDVTCRWRVTMAL